MAKILIVDDAEFLRVRISKMLVSNGHQVLEAENGAVAVNAYMANRPDAVLMDVTMPEMDGLAALKAIRSSDPNARVVMLTALGQESVVLQALAQDPALDHRHAWWSPRTLADLATLRLAHPRAQLVAGAWAAAAGGAGNRGAHDPGAGGG